MSANGPGRGGLWALHARCMGLRLEVAAAGTPQEHPAAVAQFLDTGLEVGPDGRGDTDITPAARLR
jgi:hypothetical protein